MNTSQIVLLLSFAIGGEAEVSGEFEAVLTTRAAKLELDRKVAEEQSAAAKRREEERQRQILEEVKDAARKEVLRQLLLEKKAFGKEARQQAAPFRSAIPNRPVQRGQQVAPRQVVQFRPQQQVRRAPARRGGACAT